jgi:hypothetical protein
MPRNSFQDVVLPAQRVMESAISWPSACVGCLNPSDWEWQSRELQMASSTQTLGLGTGYTSRSIQITVRFPQCALCTAYEQDRKWHDIWILALLVVVGCLFWVIPAFDDGDWARFRNPMLIAGATLGIALLVEWLHRRRASRRWTGRLPDGVVPMDDTHRWMTLSLLQGRRSEFEDKLVHPHVTVTDRVRFRFANREYAAAFATANVPETST